jgi:8-oxo-dGTP pyrophosphatase MutT (NUDIX family)
MPNRRTLLEQLENYRQRYPDESSTVERFRAFIEAHPDCFERSLAVGHLTGSAWLVNRSASHVLLTYHRKLDLWVQLGGHADGNPDLLAVALQEAREESGIAGIKPVAQAIFDLDIHRIPARGAEPAHDHYDVRFALQVTESENFEISAESHDLAWIKIRRLAEKTQEPSMLRMARKWLRCRSS